LRTIEDSDASTWKTARSTATVTLAEAAADLRRTTNLRWCIAGDAELGRGADAPW
jgi:hypothetical protein